MTEKLRVARQRVERLVDFYREHPGTTIDTMDSFTDVTFEDLKELLTALNDTALVSDGT